jgi:AcrR family transcriptional regulator
MVSQLPADSRARLLAAAAREFAARGFDGAKVDRIARQARVNKAMIYYHFRSKAGLYREILRDMFGAIAGAVSRASDAASPEDQLRRFIRAVADHAMAQPHFPAIWLREMADAGRHLDESTIAAIKQVLATLAGILRGGAASGSLRPVHPLAAHLGIVAPLLLFTATEPIRAQFAAAMPKGAGGLTRDAVIAHVETATIAALAAGAGSPAVPPAALKAASRVAGKSRRARRSRAGRSRRIRP